MDPNLKFTSDAYKGYKKSLVPLFTLSLFHEIR